LSLWGYVVQRRRRCVGVNERYVWQRSGRVSRHACRILYVCKLCCCNHVVLFMVIILLLL